MYKLAFFSHQIGPFSGVDYTYNDWAKLERYGGNCIKGGIPFVDSKCELLYHQLNPKDVCYGVVYDTINGRVKDISKIGPLYSYDLDEIDYIQAELHI